MKRQSAMRGQPSPGLVVAVMIGSATIAGAQSAPVVKAGDLLFLLKDDAELIAAAFGLGVRWPRRGPRVRQWSGGQLFGQSAHSP
jgi:hypothetical protein